MSATQPIADPIAASTPSAAPAASVSAETNIFSVLSLVLGLASILLGYTFVVPIAAIVLGVLALKREPAKRTMSIWGIVLGGVMVAAPILAIVFGVALLAPLGIVAFFAAL
jgi:hypothetical protein